MNMSIRKLLLVNLLSVVTLTTTLTLIGNYLLDKNDIADHLDLFLGQAGLSFQALLTPDPTPEALKAIQKQLKAMPTAAQAYIQGPADFDYHNRLQIQLWDKHNRLLLHSANAPTDPLTTGKAGFSDVTLQNQRWRAFTTRPSEKGYRIVVAEREDMRTQLAHRIARDDVLILSLTYPLLALLIWVILGRGLRSLKRIAKEVADRDRDYLEPVDITKVPEEIKSLVDELNQLLHRLNAALEREKRFAGDAAHELKTPLAALKTQAQVALQTTHHKQANALKNLVRSVDRSTHVVQQLLTLSRMGAETPVLTELLDLRQLAIDEIALIAPTAIEKNIDVSFACESDSTPVRGNAAALSILLRNLLDNSIRYTPPYNEVNVSIHMNKDRVTLTVADNGPGIPPALHQRVFERFFRILGTQQSGTGLGLAIVSQIVTLHQAEIKLFTPPSGRGLAVQVDFPKVSTEK